MMRTRGPCTCSCAGAHMPEATTAGWHCLVEKFFRRPHGVPADGGGGAGRPGAAAAAGGAARGVVPAAAREGRAGCWPGGGGPPRRGRVAGGVAFGGGVWLRDRGEEEPVPGAGEPRLEQRGGHGVGQRSFGPQRVPQLLGVPGWSEGGRVSVHGRRRAGRHGRATDFARHRGEGSRGRGRAGHQVSARLPGRCCRARELGRGD